MNTSSSNRIAKLRFREPCRNLPHHKNGKGEEWLFSYRFAQTYLAECRPHLSNSKKNRTAVAREIPANGYGIADLIAVNWQSIRNAQRLSPEDFERRGRPTIRAFELKLNNWRQALMQANRYRFFAHIPIVVLPASNKAALKYIETFRLLRVGLWSFDIDQKRITRHYTPRSQKPLDSRQKTRAIRLVAKATKALPIS
jgi:hypothetical protein